MRVDYTDVVKFFCGKACILITTGKTGTNIDVNDTIVFLAIFSEAVFVFPCVYGSSRTKRAAIGYMGKNFGGGDINAV